MLVVYDKLVNRLLVTIERTRKLTGAPVPLRGEVRDRSALASIHTKLRSNIENYQIVIPAKAGIHRLSTALDPRLTSLRVLKAAGMTNQCYLAFRLKNLVLLNAHWYEDRRTEAVGRTRVTHAMSS